MSKGIRSWEFPGGPEVRTRCFHCGGLGSIPGQGTRISQAARHSQKKTKQNEKKDSEVSLKRLPLVKDGTEKQLHELKHIKCKFILILIKTQKLFTGHLSRTVGYQFILKTGT